ncbi:valine--tRNA ligase [Christensenellaceae bacterium OttesenSCG-928-L17]|nr:valine--tRNA ligase [Christensenellaceae bacterium OttesenSCG-928-L17]
MDMPKTYDHSTVENRLYKEWEDKGYFHAEPNPSKPPYCIVIPPPNITGQLHMGHALDNTIQDVLIRYKRMSGYETLWLPGTDHASIATEVKIVEQMAAEGLTKEVIGREAFLERAWGWRKEYGGRIVNQLKKLGSSCDWERERFTMDEGCNRAVIKVFVELYNKGLVYRGNRIINWCPDCLSALSDIEVEYEAQDSHLWHVRYDAPDQSYSITVATTRPETILGDTAIAVHPEDERYAGLVGKEVLIPVLNRAIPIVADEYVEKDFGTGAVKITPGHDPNDFEVGQRANLPTIRVIADDGHMNENAGAYAGMTRYECREAFVNALSEAGALVKVEPYTHNVGTCYRCHTTVEAMVSDQWFVDMKPLAKPAIEAVRNGSIRFVPKRFERTYFNWMENIRDWCISRQLWWGHRIPAYYCDACGEITVQETAPAVCPKCGAGHLRQDEDVLDTWFSSGMWPFSTLGYPDTTKELEYFYPTSTLVTGYDIIFFWVARMIVFGLEAMNEKPFDTVYVHGIVRDGLGRKMSKSLGNGIDPLEVIEKHGADSLRFSLITGNSAGNDMRFYWEKVEAARNFCNKIYNAARFVLMNIGDDPIEEIDMQALSMADKWILSRLNTVVGEVRMNLDAFELGMAAQKVYDFIWTEFCDWYIEMAKPGLYGEDAKVKAQVRAILVHVLGCSMKLLHPFMPFITEELYGNLPNADETIMRSDFPVVNAVFAFEEEAEQMETVMGLIRAIRNVRAEMNVPPSKRISAILVAKEGYAEAFEAAGIYMNRLAGVESVSLRTTAEGIPGNAVSIVSAAAEAFVPLEQLVDIAQERERVEKEIARVKGEVARAEGKLNNQGFVSKAPAEVVAEEREKLATAKEMLEKLTVRRMGLD